MCIIRHNRSLCSGSMCLTDWGVMVELPLLFIDLDRSALTPIYLSLNPRLGLIAIYSGDL